MRTGFLPSARRLGGVALIFVALAAGACSDSGDAGDAISTNDPKPTATPLTLGSANPTPTALTTIITTDGAGTDTTTIVIDPGATTTATDTSANPTPTSVSAVTPVTEVLADAAFTGGSKVTTVGFDEVFFGMLPDAAAAAASTTWNGLPAEGTQPTCYVITPSNGPDGVSFWVFNGTVERVNISHTALRTRSGYGVGSTLAELQTFFGDTLQVTDFADGSQTAVFVPADASDAGYRMVFELLDGSTFRFRSGRVGVVELPDTSCA